METNYMTEEAALPRYRKKLSTVLAAAYVGLGKSTLDRSRVTGLIGNTPAPPHIKIGSRVLYDPDDLDAWLASNRRTSTSTPRQQ
jgi:hypothetical protein